MDKLRQEVVAKFDRLNSNEQNAILQLTIDLLKRRVSKLGPLKELKQGATLSYFNQDGSLWGIMTSEAGQCKWESFNEK